MTCPSRIALLILGGLAFALGCVQSVPGKKLIKRTPQERILELDKSLKKHNSPDKVDLEIIIDSEFVNKHNSPQQDWMEKLFEHIKFVDTRFKDVFNIGLEVDSIKYLELPEESPPDIYFLYSYINIKYRHTQSDLIVLFSGKDCGRNQGISTKLGAYAVVAPRLDIPVKRVFQHELSHLYGAEDVCCACTIMSNDLVFFSYNWSGSEQAVINLNCNRDWNDANEWYFELIRKNLNSFPQEDQEEIALLCSYANASRQYSTGIALGKVLLKKHPGNVFIQDCLRAIEE